MRPILTVARTRKRRRIPTHGLPPEQKRIAEIVGFTEAVDGDGVKLYGNVNAGTNDPTRWKWFERWFPTEAAAREFACKRGWDVETEAEHEARRLACLAAERAALASS